MKARDERELTFKFSNGDEIIFLGEVDQKYKLMTDKSDSQKAYEFIKDKLLEITETSSIADLQTVNEHSIFSDAFLTSIIEGYFINESEENELTFEFANGDKIIFQGDIDQKYELMFEKSSSQKAYEFIKDKLLEIEESSSIADLQIVNGHSIFDNAFLTSIFETYFNDESGVQAAGDETNLAFEG